VGALRFGAGGGAAGGGQCGAVGGLPAPRGVRAPPGGLEGAAKMVGEAKAEIARVQGTEESRQELYKVAVRADGGAVREGDAEAEAEPLARC
jgi:hypothetical protein